MINPSHVQVQPKGVTLLETMIAVAVIGVTLAGTMSAWMHSEQLQALQEEEAKVQAAIVQTINDMRALPFDQIDNVIADPPTAISGFSGGLYPGDPSPYRLLPGMKKLYLGWDGKGPKTDTALRGLHVTTTKQPGYVPLNGRWCKFVENTPELRIVFINNEAPNEARMGETPANPGDGVDLSGDGIITDATLSMDTSSGSAKPYKVEFGAVDSDQLFPRLLAVPVSNPPRAPISQYLNVSQMVVYPVIVQARWWSEAGFPREISVLTFITNRTGSKVPFPTNTAE